MAIQIKVEDHSYQEKLVTVGGNSVNITFTFNTRDSRWYFDLVDRNGIDIVSGVKILPSQNLTGHYLDVTSIIGGNFYCANTRSNREDITRDNFGTDKQFQFWYISSEEEVEKGIT
jgi:hypothetical protein